MSFYEVWTQEGGPFPKKKKKKKKKIENKFHWVSETTALQLDQSFNVITSVQMLRELSWM